LIGSPRRAGEEHDLSAKLADADLEAHAGARGGFREDERPLLPREHLWRGFAVLLQHAREIHDLFDLVFGEFFDGKEMVHERAGRKGKAETK
jgi:hypothetical protein